jgi:DNA polymerase-3 subunit alpha (Gram-positive type)
MLTEFVSFDVETTGLNPATDRVIELAAVRWHDGHIIAAFHTLVNPETPIHPASYAVHGISDAEVRRAPRIGDVLQLFEAFRGALPLVAHNAPFDLGFLSSESMRAHYPLRAARVLDTLTLSRHVFKEQPSHKLVRLSVALDLQAVQHHRALADAETAGRLAWRAITQAGDPPESAWINWHPDHLAAAV